MLVLTRRCGESVKLSLDGKELGTIHVLPSHNGNNKLGFDLHPKLTVTRTELGGTYQKNYNREQK